MAQKGYTFGPLLEVQMSKKCTPLKSNASKCYTLGPLLEVEMSKKVHANVARSTFWSQIAQNTSKHYTLGPLLEAEILKKCAPLWRDTHVQVKCSKSHTFGPLLEIEMSKKSARRGGAKQILKSKCWKTPQVQTTFWSWDVEQVHTVVAWSTFGSQNKKKIASGPLLDVQPSLATLHHNSNNIYYSYNCSYNKFYSYNCHDAKTSTTTTFDNDNYNYTTTAITTTTALITLHHNYNHNDDYNYLTAETTLHYAAPHCIQQLWARRPLQPLQRAQLQPPVCPSVDSPCHPCLTAT